MIDDSALKILIAVHEQSNSLPACLVGKDVATIHSAMFLLDLPASEIQLKKRTWPVQPRADAASWRTRMPKGLTYLSTSAIKGTDKGGLEYTQFEALDGTATCYMQGALYDLLREQLDNPVFRIIDAPGTEGQKMGIVVFVDNELVGAVGALLPPDTG